MSEEEQALEIRKAVARCIEIIREMSADFLSEEYALGQPMSSFRERFAVEQCANAIEQEFGLGTIEQSHLLGKPTPFELHTASLTPATSPSSTKGEG